MNEAWALVLVVCGGIVTIAGAATVLWWLIKPRVADWVEEQLVRPVRETHHQVTVNHHSSAEPTVLDRLDTVTTAVRAQSAEVESLHENVTNLTEMFVEHIRGSVD